MPGNKTRLQVFQHTEDSAGLVRISPRTQSIFLSVHVPGLILYWKLGKTSPSARLEGHNSNISAISFGTEEHVILSGSEAGTVLLWDMNVQKAVCSLKGNRSAVTSLSVGESDTVATSSADGVVKLWDSRSKEVIDTLTSHLGAANCVEFSPQATWVASGGADHTIYLWDLKMRRNLHEFRAGDSNVQLMTFHPQETFLMCAGLDRSIRGWELSAFAHVPETKCAGQPQWLSFDPLGRCLFLAIGDRIQILDVQTWTAVGFLDAGEGDIMHMSPAESLMISVQAQDHALDIWSNEYPQFPVHEEESVDISEEAKVPYIGVPGDSAENQALLEVNSNHSVYMDLFHKKKESLNAVLQWWSESNVNATIGSLTMLKDVPVSADVLKTWVVESEGERVQLEHLPLLLPICLKLIESRYESFIRVGLAATHTLMGRFQQVLTSTMGIGGERDDQYRRCEACLMCFTQLRNSQALIKSVKRKNKVSAT